nr:dihydrofolate reductase family protein [Streptomyces nanshensis]
MSHSTDGSGPRAARIITSISLSLDGFFEGPDHDIDWHTVDEELHQHFNDYFRTMGGFVEGRVTYELMEEFWPTADQDPANEGPMAEFAGIWRDMPKFVFSRTLESVGPNATLFHEVDPEQVRGAAGPSAYQSSGSCQGPSSVPSTREPGGRSRPEEARSGRGFGSVAMNQTLGGPTDNALCRSTRRPRPVPECGGRARAPRR